MLVETSKKMNDVTQKVMKLWAKVELDPETISHMDVNQLLLLQSCIELVNVSCELILETTEMMANIDYKIDTLLERTEKA